MMSLVLILIVVEDGLVQLTADEQLLQRTVLILIVVEDGLVLSYQLRGMFYCLGGLNPYCSGRWSRTILILYSLMRLISVLILIVVEDGLVQFEDSKTRDLVFES